MEIWLVGLGWLLFAGTHIGMGSVRFRSALINKVGEQPFQGIFSLVALITFGFLIYAFVTAKSTEIIFLEIGKTNNVVSSISHLLMILALILLIGGFANKTPMGMVDTEPKAFGITRITRHPMNMSFALFGLSHVLVNRTVADWLFYGGFILYGFFGALHQDYKKNHLSGNVLSEFISSTSILPFAANITGKQPIKFGEVSKVGIIVGLVVAAIARILHPDMLDKLF